MAVIPPDAERKAQLLAPSRESRKERLDAGQLRAFRHLANAALLALADVVATGGSGVVHTPANSGRVPRRAGVHPPLNGSVGVGFWVTATLVEASFATPRRHFNGNHATQTWPFCRRKSWWRGTELNCRHHDFQSCLKVIGLGPKETLGSFYCEMVQRFDPSSTMADACLQDFLLAPPRLRRLNAK